MTENEFWKRIDKRDLLHCWNWTGAVSSNGYGALHWQGKFISSHVLAYKLTHPNSNGKLHVLHSCDNRICCNPAHLHAGTPADNAREMVERGRSLTGVKNPSATLTPDKVRFIRQDRRPQRAIARDFHVSQSVISDIKNRKKWASLK